MATLVQFDFKFSGPFGAEMTQALDGLARSIAAEPGLRWKVWTENEATGEAGGIYLFEDDARAGAYIEMHRERLAKFGITGINAKRFHVNEALTQLTRGPI